ncbi:MAG: hypothetical protein DRN68_02055 [Thaumarchaeota archaeon]|nr:MAG: hypothetical protein DRN68_02055 [Nitrososphaerota archaeon]
MLDKYRRRGWLSDSNYLKARLQFLGETLRFLRLKLLKIVPSKTSILIQTWSLIERSHLQILSAKQIGAEKLYTGDEVLHKVALGEGIKSEYVD